MPKSTKMLMVVYFAIVCAMAAAVVLDRPGMRHYELYELIRSAFMFGMIGFLSVWLTLSPGQRRRKFAYLAGLVVALSGMELFTAFGNSAEDVVFGFFAFSALAAGTALAAGYFLIKGFAILRPELALGEASAAPLRFSLREIFLVTLLCAVLLGLRQLFDVDWEQFQNILPIALVLFTFGAIPSAAAWAMLMPPRPWFRVPLGLAGCMVPWGAFFVFLSYQGGPAQDGFGFGKYLAAFYVTSLAVFATLRHAGFRLLRRTRSSAHPATDGDPVRQIA